MLKSGSYSACLSLNQCLTSKFALRHAYQGSSVLIQVPNPTCLRLCRSIGSKFTFRHAYQAFMVLWKFPKSCKRQAGWIWNLKHRRLLISVPEGDFEKTKQWSSDWHLKSVQMQPACRLITVWRPNSPSGMLIKLLGCWLKFQLQSACRLIDVLVPDLPSGMLIRRSWCSGNVQNLDGQAKFGTNTSIKWQAGWIWNLNSHPRDWVPNSPSGMLIRHLWF